ncbi:class I SAM-dependent methyltransferase [Hymenobacter perfusus]|uniref:Class I SAM-dependent methyltransferase n=2 Tax=Hymenobacter perfusus TaxID=1236770 RepID=A0A3R9M7C3_9BACT|nr:class I SAM-dependent methyltransferase [Hymenobacter perfusus]
MFSQKPLMKRLKALIDSLKRAFNAPSPSSTIGDRDGALLRVERKLDLLSQQLIQLGLEPLANQTDEPTEDQRSKLVPGRIPVIDQKLENQFLQLESLFSIYNSLPNLKLLPPTRGWAGSPDFLAKIIEVILKQKPAFVLEASSGVSTVVIALALKLNNCGKVVSLDHEDHYAAKTRENVKVNEAESNSIVQHCPLKEYTVGEQSWKWYDIEEVDLTRKIDILVIDGPPRTTQFLARYPAVPLLHEYFADKALVLLDDANRDDEVIIVGKWIAFLEAINYKVEVHMFNHFEKGMVMLEVCRVA